MLFFLLLSFYLRENPVWRDIDSLYLLCPRWPISKKTRTHKKQADFQLAFSKQWSNTRNGNRYFFPLCFIFRDYVKMFFFCRRWVLKTGQYPARCDLKFALIKEIRFYFLKSHDTQGRYVKRECELKTNCNFIVTSATLIVSNKAYLPIANSNRKFRVSSK